MKAMTKICVAMLVLCAAAARAAENYDPAALARAIEPYLDESTMWVAHVDMTRVDLAPAVARIKELFPKFGPPEQQAAMMADMDKGVATANQWIADFVKAGGRDYYIVVSMSGFPDFPAYAVVPLKPGADGQAIVKLLALGNAPEQGVEAELRGNLVVWGTKAARERLMTPSATPRPELAKAFEAAGDSAAQGLFVPSADTRKVLLEMIPTPPQGPMAGVRDIVAKGITWSAMGASASPGPSMNIVIQSPDAPAATALAGTLDKWIAVGKQSLAQFANQSPEAARAIGDIDAMARAFTPTVSGDRLTMRLGTDESLKFSGLLVPAMAKARFQARQVRSASNMKQLLMGCLMYANENKGQFPPDLKSMVKSMDLPPDVLRNPATPEREVDYMYVRPAKGSAAGADVVVVYESFDAPPAVLNVGFADGHVELMRYAQFERALAATKARNETK